MASRAVTTNEQQRIFAELYVNDPQTAGNGTASAAKAGYAADCAAQTAFRLLRHDGVRAEIDRLTRQALGDHAAAAVQLLGRVVRDDNMHMKLRISAAKTILDRAGYIAPKAGDAPAQPLDPRNVDKWSLAELEKYLDETRARIAATEAAMIDVTPAAVEAAEAG